MSKLTTLVKGKCKDMGLSETAIESLIQNMGAGINGESTDEEIESVATTIAAVAKTMQSEATRWATKKQPKQQEETTKQEGGEGGDLADKIAAIIEARVKPLQDQITAMNGAAIAKSRRELVEKELDGASDTVRRLVLAGFEGREFADDTKFDEYLGTVKADVAALKGEATASAMKGQNAPGFSKKNSDGVSEAVAAYVSKTTTPDNGMGGKSL